MSSEKSLAPTPFHRRQAREQGRFAQSRDVTHAAILLAGAAMFYACGTYLFESYTAAFREVYSADAWLTAAPGRFMEAWHFWTTLFFAGVFPILALVACVGVAAAMIQSRFLFLPGKILPDWENINPAKGLSKIFSWNSLATLFFGVLKMTFLALFAWWILTAELATVLRLPAMETALAIQTATHLLLLLAVKLAAVLFVLALADYGWQWWRFEQELRMTLQEFRDEMKITEGNPETRGRSREKMKILSTKKS